MRNQDIIILRPSSLEIVHLRLEQQKAVRDNIVDSSDSDVKHEEQKSL